MTTALRIEYRRLDEIVPAERNPKGHDLDGIIASMRRHGFVEPIIEDARTGRLVGGHGRLEALMAMLVASSTDDDVRPPDRIGLADDGMWLVPVVVGYDSATDGDAEALLVGLNQLTTTGGWMDAELAPLLAGLDDLAGTGFNQDQVEALLASVDTITVHEHERAPAEPKEPADVQQRVQPGDVWLLGPHRLMCGDSRNPDHVTRLLDGATINLAFTSPPYADRRTYDETSGFRPIPPDEYVAWFAPVAANVAAHLADDGSWFVNIRAGANNGERDLYVYDLVIAHRRTWDWLFVDDLCWVDGNNGVPGGWPNRFKDAWEPVFHFARSRQIKFRPLANGHQSERVPSDVSRQSASGSGLLSPNPQDISPGMARPSNVITLVAEHAQLGHSAAFPVGLPAWFIRAYTDEGDTVYDPFMGSGSTILAADQHTRIGYGMELSPGYCDVILDRWERHGGTTPIRTET